MSDPAGLQFDTAEPTTGSASEIRCAACGDKLAQYFAVNGSIACGRCKDKLVKALAGSHVPTLLRATGLGLVAAAAGFALYYGVAVVTGYEIGFISIVVGLLVGFAVRKGSRARGGWRYQALAMFLTYLAISSTYLPRVLHAMKEREAQRRTAPTATPVARENVPAAPVATTAPEQANGKWVGPVPQQAGEGGAGAPPAPPATIPSAAPPATAAASPPPPEVTFGQFLLAGLMLAAFTLALPFLGGFENAMGLVIIGIGLWEAWKVNRIPALSVTGPHAVSAPKAADA